MVIEVLYLALQAYPLGLAEAAIDAVPLTGAEVFLACKKVDVEVQPSSKERWTQFSSTRHAAGSASHERGL